MCGKCDDSPIVTQLGLDTCDGLSLQPHAHSVKKYIGLSTAWHTLGGPPILLLGKTRSTHVFVIILVFVKLERCSQANAKLLNQNLSKTVLRKPPCFAAIWKTEIIPWLAQGSSLVAQKIGDGGWGHSRTFRLLKLCLRRGYPPVCKYNET